MDKHLSSPAAAARSSVVGAPWAVTPAKVEAAVERIATTVRPACILAFGSRARGNAAPESDLDLLVVLPKGQPEAGVSSVIQAQLKGLLLGVDLVVIEETRFEQLRRARSTLYWDAAREGVTLYANGTARRVAIAQVSG